MGTETAAERASMLGITDFGVDVIFSPGNSYPNRNDRSRKIQAIFDNVYFDVAGTESSISSSQPMLTCQSADVAGAERNSMCEIGLDVYKVIRIEPDGTGITMLALEGPRRL